MTTPAHETLEREKDKLYITDAEMYRWLGVPYSVAKPIIPQLEAKYGFPKKNALFGGRRYRPAIRKWLDENHGLLTRQNGTPAPAPRGSVQRGGRP